MEEKEKADGGVTGDREFSKLLGEEVRSNVGSSP